MQSDWYVPELRQATRSNFPMSHPSLMKILTTIERFLIHIEQVHAYHILVHRLSTFPAAELNSTLVEVLFLEPKS